MIRKRGPILWVSSWQRHGFVFFLHLSSGASLIAQLVKNSPAIQETPVRFLGQEDPLKNG